MTNRILFFAPRFHTNQSDIINLLKNNGYDVWFAALTKGQIENYNVCEPIIIKESKLYTILTYLFKSLDIYDARRRLELISIPTIIRLLKNYRPHIIIIRNPDSLPGLSVFIISYLFNIKVVFYHQSPFYGNKSKRTRYIQVLNKFMGTCSFTPVFGDSKYDKTIAINNFYLRFPIPLSNVRTRVKPTTSTIKIISVAKLRLNKNIKLVIEAFSQLLNDFELELTIVTQIASETDIIELNYLMKYIHDKNLGSRVHVLSNIDNSKMSELYSNNDIFVLSSHNDPFPYSVLEAISVGLPVITSDSVGSRHYINSGCNGVIFRSNDVDSLKKAIAKIIMDGIDNYKKNSLSTAKNLFTHENFLDDFNKVLIHYNLL